MDNEANRSGWKGVSLQSYIAPTLDQLIHRFGACVVPKRIHAYGRIQLKVVKRPWWKCLSQRRRDFQICISKQMYSNTRLAFAFSVLYLQLSQLLPCTQPLYPPFSKYKELHSSFQAPFKNIGRLPGQNVASHDVQHWVKHDKNNPHLPTLRRTGQQGTFYWRIMCSGRCLFSLQITCINSNWEPEMRKYRFLSLVL